MKSPLSLSLLAALFLLSFDVAAVAAKLADDTAKVFAASAPAGGEATLPDTSQFIIPGPLRSFLRLAAISQKVTSEEVLPLLSRNIFTDGYEGESRPTEFLVLLRRYVVQARELSSLAATSGMVIRVTNCDDAKPLLRILGYRTRGDCGETGLSLLTEDPERAFLAIDSGFPLHELEQTLQGGKLFEYAYSSSPVPVLFTESDWTGASIKNHRENSRDLLDTMLNDSSIARLYWAMSKLDPETSQTLESSLGIGKMLPYATVLDFYGRRLCISNGRVIVPGGAEAEPAWKELVGASPASPAAFVAKLISKDKGWLAAYFDVLSRASATQQAYFTDPQHLPLFYRALRTPDPSAPATRGSFRPAPALLLLATRLQFENAGRPTIPGNLDVWRDILIEQHGASFVRKSRKVAPKLDSPEQFLQVMFALSRAPTESGPLQVYMAICELDSRRPSDRRLSPATVRLLAHRFEEFSDQYRIFSEFPELTDESIAQFMETVQNLHSMPRTVRGNAFGIFQANVGIWQVLARQGEIPRSQINDSWKQMVIPFSSIRSASQLYDAGRSSVGEIFRAAVGKPKGSQDEIIDLLAGPAQTTPEGIRMHREVASRIRSVLNDQRLVSLDTLFTLGNALTDQELGKRPEEFVIHLAGQTKEFEMPRPIFTSGERTEWAAGIYNDHHTELQMHTDIAKILKAPNASHAQIDEARGQLASFLRDSLVGLNYAYYEPPGAQALHNNPLFVRSHDFAGETVTGIKTLWQAPELLGQGTPAGGGAHFVGSLADLPFVLSEIEEDFISPDSVQALIWKELTPGLLTSAILPRWWNVSPAELHAVALYQKAGEELLTASAKDEVLRSKVAAILSDRLPPQRVQQVERAARADKVATLLPLLMPADTFYLEAEFRRRYPLAPTSLGTAAQELQQLSEQHPEQVNWARLSHDFGTPHPSLTQNYGLELLNLMPMPPFSGYPSRFLGESLDSPNLYWARLADEAGYSPVMLNHYVPELTRLMVEKIFATDFEDWPAILRAMHEAGDDFRAGKLASPARVSEVVH